MNGTPPWHLRMASPPSHPEMAPHHGTIPSAKVATTAPPQLLNGSKNPYSSRSLGKNSQSANSAEELCGFGRICELGHPVRIPSVGWIWNAKRSGTQSRKEGCLGFRHFWLSLSMFVVYLYLHVYIYNFIYLFLYWYIILIYIFISTWYPCFSLSRGKGQGA